MAGKGSRPQPLSVPQDTFASNFDRIFGGCDHPAGEVLRIIGTLVEWRCSECGEVSLDQPQPPLTKWKAGMLSTVMPWELPDPETKEEP